jgi:hypothetical protein
MTTEPDQIRAQVAALLTDLPDLDGVDVGDPAEIEAVAMRLEEAHDVLVRALESVEKGPAAGGAGGLAR